MYDKTRGRQIMRHFFITAAAMTAFAALVSVPASALDNHGPTQVGNQCFKPAAGGSRDLNFGAWSACPQQASIATPAPIKRKKK
jgi:uncharacterized membrane protein